MKKIFLQIVLPILIIGGAILSIGISCCGPGPNPIPAVTPCDTAATKFMTLYNAHSFANNYNLDFQVQEYTFKSNVAGSICAVGYQGHPNLAAGNYYKIEIIDATSSTVLSTGVYTFASTYRSYQNFVTPISIAANTAYIVRRTVVNNLGSVANTLTNYKQIGPALPLTNGTLSITATKGYDFYTGVATNVNTNGFLPCIDFVIN
jgi:hypothetical protein